MQRATSGNPPAVFFTIAADAFPMTIIQHGAGAVCFYGGITAGVRGVLFISRLAFKSSSNHPFSDGFICCIR